MIFSGADRKTHLIDMNGNEVKRWDYPVIDPALNGGKRGHVLLQLADLAAPDKLASPGNGLANQALGELDWDGRRSGAGVTRRRAAPPISTTTSAGWPTATPCCWRTRSTR